MRNRTVTLLAVGISVFMLTACGDDTDVTVPEPTSRDTEVPVVSSTPDPVGFSSSPVNELAEEDQAEQSGEPSLPTEELAVPTEEPEEPPTLYITVSAAGDVTLGNYYGQGFGGSFQEVYNKQRDPAYFFENVYDIFSRDDMTIVNLEGPLTNAKEHKDRTYCIGGDPEYVNILTAGSVEAVSMGNNHRLDYYEKGCDDTVAALESVGISYAYGKY